MIKHEIYKNKISILDKINNGVNAENLYVDVVCYVKHRIVWMVYDHFLDIFKQQPLKSQP